MKIFITVSLLFSLFALGGAQVLAGGAYDSMNKPGILKVADDTKQLKTIMLNVDKMTCNMCPITVKKALRKLDGVVKVKAKYEGDGVGWAKITYDPSKINPEDLTFATEMAGYPSRIAAK